MPEVGSDSPSTAEYRGCTVGASAVGATVRPSIFVLAVCWRGAFFMRMEHVDERRKNLST
jgi:hypothetical protein